VVPVDVPLLVEVPVDVPVVDPPVLVPPVVPELVLVPVEVELLVLVPVELLVPPFPLLQAATTDSETSEERTEKPEALVIGGAA